MKSDFVGLKSIPEAEHTLRCCRGLRKGLTVWRPASMSNLSRSIRFVSRRDVLLAAQGDKRVPGVDPVTELLPGCVSVLRARQIHGRVTGHQWPTPSSPGPGTGSGN